MSILVLGVGNILLTDEGIGVRVVEALEARYRAPEGVAIVDGGTAGMELLELLSSHEQLILVDAVNTGDAPGTLVELRGNQVPALFRSKISPHQLGISDLLAVLALTGELPRDLLLFGVVPYSLDTGTELTEAMVEKQELLVQSVVEELASRGYPLVPVASTALAG